MRFIKEFRIVDLDLGTDLTRHSLYLKEHTEKNSSNEGRVLFVGNIDYGRPLSDDQVDSYLRELFSCFGDIESISVSKFKTQHEDTSSSRNARFAHIVYRKKKSVKEALQATDEFYEEIGATIAKNYGIAELIARKKTRDILKCYCLGDCDPDELQSEVDSYMREFEAKEEEYIRERQRKFQEVDEDGFMMMKPRKKRKRQGTAPVHTKGVKRSRSGAKNKELKNFYRFQMREEKRTKLAELRQKFEQDKEKIAQMKAARKFKPF